ncbi:MAG: RNA polymerase sigma factor [Candidatus Coproplasma sp.]
MDNRKIGRLLTDIANGNPSALEKLYKESKNGVYAFIFKYLKNTADTEDCVQDVYLKVSLNAKNFKKDTNGRAWLLQVAKNTALDYLRKRSKTENTQTDLTRYEPPCDTPVFEAINKALTDEEAEIIIRHVIWGYKHREIAEDLGLPVGTVTAKYKRSVEKLKKYLKEESI